MRPHIIVVASILVFPTPTHHPSGRAAPSLLSHAFASGRPSLRSVPNTPRLAAAHAAFGRGSARRRPRRAASSALGRPLLRCAPTSLLPCVLVSTGFALRSWPSLAHAHSGWLRSGARSLATSRSLDTVSNLLHRCSAPQAHACPSARFVHSERFIRPPVGRLAGPRLVSCRRHPLSRGGSAGWCLRDDRFSAGCTLVHPL